MAREHKITKETEVGRTINRLKILDFYLTPTNNPKGYIKNVDCECIVCGFVCSRYYFNLHRFGCRECFRLSQTDQPLFGKITAGCIAQCKKAAVKRGKVFDLTPEYLWKVCLDQEERCYLTDLLMVFEKRSFGRGTKTDPYTSSIDRIDSSKGYVEGNIQWVHKDVNIFKNEYSNETFISMCNLMNTFDGIFPEYDYQETKNHGCWRGCGNLSRFVWTMIKRAAVLRNIEVRMSIDDAWNMYVSQGGTCAMTGCPIILIKSHKGRIGGKQTASLDRIDSYGPYSVENCMWVHKYVNISRWGKYDLDYYKEMCRLVALKHPRVRSEIPLLETIS